VEVVLVVVVVVDGRKKWWWWKASVPFTVRLPVTPLMFGNTIALEVEISLLVELVVSALQNGWLER
jgi:hypothetical protein